MTAFDWIAIVGAAAWLPQIGLFAYRVLVRPRIHFLPVKQCELTFNTLGPIFNVRAAIVVERKDAVITQMTVTLRHENGRAIVLEWDSYVEQISELKTHTGERGEFARDQAATALRVTTTIPTEKFFRFRDPAFGPRLRELTAKAGDGLNRVPHADEAAMSTFLRSREFTDLVSFHNNSFPWEPGQYAISISVRILGSKKPIVGTASTALSADEVDRIRRNLPLIEQRYRQISEGLPNEQLASPSYWASPRLDEREIKLLRP